MRNIILSSMLAFVMTGCATKDSSAKITRSSGYTTLGQILVKELNRFGCGTHLEPASFGSKQTHWIIDRDPDGAALWIEGDFTEIVLNEFRKQFGEPAFFKSPDSNGNLFFVYKREQCGVLVDCSIEPNSAWGLKAPITSIGIHTKLAKFY